MKTMLPHFSIYFLLWVIFQITQPGKISEKNVSSPEIIEICPVKTNDLNPNKYFYDFFTTNFSDYLKPDPVKRVVRSNTENCSCWFSKSLFERVLRLFVLSVTSSLQTLRCQNRLKFLSYIMAIQRSLWAFFYLKIY